MTQTTDLEREEKRNQVAATLARNPIAAVVLAGSGVTGFVSQIFEGWSGVPPFLVSAALVILITERWLQRENDPKRLLHACSAVCAVTAALVLVMLPGTTSAENPSSSDLATGERAASTTSTTEPEVDVLSKVQVATPEQLLGDLDRLRSAVQAMIDAGWTAPTSTTTTTAAPAS